MVDWLTRRRTYRQSGSFRFNAAERESYALILDLKILSVVGVPFEDLRVIPPKSFYGNATIFERTTPREIIQVGLPRFRLLNVRNDFVGRQFDDRVSEINQGRFRDDVAAALQFVLSAFRQYPDTGALRHRESIVKFKGLPLCQFEFTCYHLPFTEGPVPEPEFNDDPPRGGADEYFEPARNPVDNPYVGNPEPSPIPGAADPRDFAPQENPGDLIPGTLEYEFRRGDNGNFEVLTKAGVFWPGQLVAGPVPNFQNAISWVDDEGNSTPLTTQNNVQAVVRFVEFNADDGRLFVPDPNTLTDS